MAAKTTPNGSNIYQPFIGFTYKDASGNMWHSITDLKIYRTSNGNRYNESITPAMTDKVVDVPGGDGQYYFGTTFKNRTFTVDYVFEELTKTEIDTIKTIFRGDGIHELVFDEDRDTNGNALKIWSAKVTGTATMKHLCFEEDGEDIYKGEGSITFTCYYPYARSTQLEIVGRENDGDLPTPLQVQFKYTNNTNKDGATGYKTKISSFKLVYTLDDKSKEHIVQFENFQEVEVGKTVEYLWDSRLGLVYKIGNDKKTLVGISSNSIFNIPKGATIGNQPIYIIIPKSENNEKDSIISASIIDSSFYKIYY